MRNGFTMDKPTTDRVARSCWKGSKVEDAELISAGDPWVQQSVMEVLYVRRVDFYDTNLPT